MPPLPPPRAPRRKRTTSKRPPLTPDAVVAAALDVLSAPGFAGLSMRDVAEHLGVGTAAVYAQVTSKDELLELVYDALVGRIALPAPDPARWRDQVHQILGDLVTVLAAYPDATLAGFGRIPTSANILRGAECLCALLRAGGISDLAIALGLDQLILHVQACALEVSVYQRTMSPEELGRYLQEVHDYYLALPAVTYPVLASIAPDMIGHDAASRFRFGIDAILTGLAAGPGH
jgi:AcrR family transcriptional regulator